MFVSEDSSSACEISQVAVGTESVCTSYYDSGLLTEARSQPNEKAVVRGGYEQGCGSCHCQKVHCTTCIGIVQHTQLYTHQFKVHTQSTHSPNCLHNICNEHSHASCGYLNSNGTCTIGKMSHAALCIHKTEVSKQNKKGKQSYYTLWLFKISTTFSLSVFIILQLVPEHHQLAAPYTNYLPFLLYVCFSLNWVTVEAQLKLPAAFSSINISSRYR